MTTREKDREGKRETLKGRKRVTRTTAVRKGEVYFSGPKSLNKRKKSRSRKKGPWFVRLAYGNYSNRGP